MGNTKANPSKFNCYQKAEPDEPTFTLIGRDPLAAELVRDWADEFEELIGDDATDEDREKIAEARTCADAMREYSTRRHGLGRLELK